jgi:hypothetical protein
MQVEIWRVCWPETAIPERCRKSVRQNADMKKLIENTQHYCRQSRPILLKKLFLKTDTHIMEEWERFFFEDLR